MNVDLAREADFSLGQLRIRPSVRQVESPDGAETLEPRIMQVLVVVGRRVGEVVSRNDLIEACWDGRIVGDDALNRCVSRIRKLGDAADAFEIETIPKVGYRLTLSETAAALAVAEAECGPKSAAPEFPAAPPAPEPALAVPHPAASPRPPDDQTSWLNRMRAQPIQAVAVGVLALIALFAGFSFLTNRTAPDSDQVVSVTAPRIAVLPFEAVGGDNATAIARAAPATIADILHQAGETILSPQLRANDEPGQRLARDFGAAYIVEGQATQSGGQISLVTRIVNIDGVMIWSRQVSAPLERGGDLPQQSAIVVADVFRWLRGHPFTGPNVGEAQAAFLRPVDNHRRGDALAGYDAARRDVAARPDDARARILAVWLARGAMASFPPAERPERLAMMLEDARRAEELEPDYDGIWTARANILPPVAFVEMLDVVTRGLEAAPDSAEMRNYMSTHLVRVGRIAESEVFARQSTAMDPVSPAKAHSPTLALVRMGRYAEALRESESLLDRWPDSARALRLRFQALLWRGEHARARALLDDPDIAARLDTVAERRPARSLILALEERTPAAIAAFARDCADPNRLSWEGLAWCLLGLTTAGRLDDAFHISETLYPAKWAATEEERYQLWIADPPLGNVGLLFDAVLAPLRADPRIIPIFQRVGLIDYWKETGSWPDFCATEPESVCAEIQAAHGTDASSD